MKQFSLFLRYRILNCVSMKIMKRSLVPALFCFCLPVAVSAQSDCNEFKKVITLMQTGFGSAKGTKGTESTTNYGVMILTKKIWASNYKFPESVSAEITEILRDAPDPKLAGHNIYISFNIAKNVTKDVAEAAFNKIK